MDFKFPGRFRCPGPRGLTAFLFLALLAAPSRGADDSWKKRIAPASAGAFPEIRPFTATYRFGWSDIEAARATASVTYEDGQCLVEAKGGTSGLARALWQMDATHIAAMRRGTLDPLWYWQFERYSRRSITMQGAFTPKGLWRIRKIDPDPGKVANWKRLKLAPIRDMVSAMFFVRSQKLENGDKIGMISYPGDSPYLVEIKVLGRENIDIAGTSRPAIKMDLQLHKISTGKGTFGKLEEHRKFRGGRVWISDDQDRIPLRAEVNIFIGYVFAELDSVKFR